MADRHKLLLAERLALAEVQALGEVDTEKVAEGESRVGVADGECDTVGECKAVGEDEGDNVLLTVSVSELVPQDVAERHRLALEEKLALAVAHGLGEVETEKVAESENKEAVGDGDSDTVGDIQVGEEEGDRVLLTVSVSELVPQDVAERHRLALEEKLALAVAHGLGEAETEKVAENENTVGVPDGDWVTVGECKEEADEERESVLLTVSVSELVPQDVAERHRLALEEKLALAVVHGLGEVETEKVAESENKEVVGDGESVTLGDSHVGEVEGDSVSLTV